jgi:hypothetical protein
LWISAMADVDVSQGARDLVEHSAENVSKLGEHLHQIGELINLAKISAPVEGQVSATEKIRRKAELFTKYQEDRLQEQKEKQEQFEADQERQREWRKHAGNEGASLLDELARLGQEKKELEKIIEKEGIKLFEEKMRVRDMIVVLDKKTQKLVKPCQKIIKLEEQYSDNAYLRAALCSWVQNTFDEVRFQFKAAQEKEKLKIEHHRGMRKTRAEARLKCVREEKDKRLLQACFVRFQEECIEGRHVRHLYEIQQKYEDDMLVMNSQLAQALGDEEAAKELVAEQTRRMEAARQAEKEANRKRKAAEAAQREAEKEAKHANELKEEALAAQAKAEQERDAAKAARKVAEAERDAANVRAEESEKARAEAEDAKEAAEEDLRRKLKKIDSLQRMLAELGAESDSDCPPDERPPPFFVNNDGTKVGRPRTRKERMAMAYREAEVARWELRLGLAVMIDKDINTASAMDRLKFELRLTEQECDEVRWANKVLVTDVNTISAALAAAKRQPPADMAVQTSLEDGGVYAPLPAPPTIPLAPSTAAVSAYDPTRPQFIALKDNPDLLKKTSSAPIFMPPLCADSVLMKGLASEKITLAPLRRKKKPPTQWSVSWH